MSHKLKVGEIQETYLTDEDIWRVLTRLLSNKAKKSATYKFGLVKSIIENLYQVNDQLEITYDQLAFSFSKIYWNLVIHHELQQGTTGSAVQNNLEEIQQKYNLPRDFSFDRLNSRTQLEIIKKVKAVMKTNVFGALYGDTKGLFYAFDHKREYLRLNKPVHIFMMKYQALIVDLVNYHMAKMIEKLNDTPNINYLLEKVESIARRGSLKPFERILITYFEQTCFYCGKSLHTRNSKTHVDHFIPWSFVQSDQIWNLVLACSQCNTSKNDKIPERSFLNNILERNKILVNETQLTENMSELITYQDKKIEMLYDYSIQNGFNEIWVP
ncbi:HNH endonuclease [Pontibacillus yanchengensis]|uniref:HNH endonuclease n=1 Tax=Pontibacillus yanchengensis Y32 TaxID=1385514 RepID=A0A0A2TIH8_9BACI|nr:HNH endonuclease signature motif containing protein [Pontibacillus yanchengensis]KGP74268.1 HNH endonuclease [Pontibacillus yanchengensis Y32]